MGIALRKVRKERKEGRAMSSGHVLNYISSILRNREARGENHAP